MERKDNIVKQASDEVEYVWRGHIFPNPYDYQLRRICITGLVLHSGFRLFSPRHKPDSEVSISFCSSVEQGIEPVEYKEIFDADWKALRDGIWIHINTPLEECLEVQPSLNQWFNSDYAPKSSLDPNATVWDWLQEQEDDKGMSKPFGEWILLEG